MKRILLVLVCLALHPVFSQNVGDQETAGFDNGRTYFNPNVHFLRPPIRLSKTIPLRGVSNATSLAVFENRFLVGEGGTNVTYRLFEESGDVVWTASLPGNGTLDYVPAVGNGVVILGGPGGAGIRVVKASDGTELWSRDLGDANGRYPVLNGSTAIVAGQRGVVAANATTGEVFWQLEATTRATPITLAGNRVFVAESQAVRGLDACSGQSIWSFPTGPELFGGTPRFLATEELFYVASSSPAPAQFWVARAENLQNVVFGLQAEFSTHSRTSPVALAHGRLFRFFDSHRDGHPAAAAPYAAARVDIFEQHRGRMLFAEPGEGLDFAFVAADVVYYYHRATGRIRARDADSGELLWSISKGDVRGISAVGESLVVLLPSSIEIYRVSRELYLPHFAAGMGYNTHILLTNPTEWPDDAVVEFLDANGQQVEVPIEGSGKVSQLTVSVPRYGSKMIYVSEEPSGLLSGWVRVTPREVRLRAASIFRFAGLAQAQEAGVEDSPALGLASVAVQIDETVQSALALANPGDQAAVVQLTLVDSQSGHEIATASVTVPSLGHLAGFVSELFESVAMPFTGTVRIQSDVPVAVVALRTSGGIPLSSYPVAHWAK